MFVRGIEIDNVYWMLAYALEQFEEARLLATGEEPSESPIGPFAHCLVKGVERLLRKGLYREYATRVETIPGIRGRLLLSQTVRMNSLSHGSAVCELDDLTYDVVHNRIIKRGLEVVIGDESLPHPLRREARAIAGRLSEVQRIDVDRRSFRALQLGGHNRAYRFVLDIARFVILGIRPTTYAGGRRFYDFDVDRTIPKIFESFVRGFFRTHLDNNHYEVKRTRRQWSGVQADEQSLRLLPQMETDIILETADRMVVIDTKFYSSVLRKYRGGEKVHERHLYQLMGYLHNLRMQHGPAQIVGMLLYASTGVNLDARWDIHGFPVRAYALDLSRPWEEIGADLLSIAEAWPAVAV